MYLNVIAGWSCLKLDNKEMNVIFLTLVGITLFVLLFEGRARYLFLYSPYYIISAIVGLKFLLEKYKEFMDNTLKISIYKKK